MEYIYWECLSACFFGGGGGIVINLFIFFKFPQLAHSWSSLQCSHIEIQSGSRLSECVMTLILVTSLSAELSRLDPFLSSKFTQYA